MEPLDDVFEGLPENDRSIRFVNKSIGIGVEIIAAMARKNMTQRDLARALDINETLISRWLGGMHNFTLRTLSAIEEILETDLVLTAEQVAEKMTQCHPVVLKIPRHRVNITTMSPKEWVIVEGTKHSTRRAGVATHRLTQHVEYSDV